MAERGLDQLVRPVSDAEVGRLVDAYARIVWNTLYRPGAFRLTPHPSASGRPSATCGASRHVALRWHETLGWGGVGQCVRT